MRIFLLIPRDNAASPGTFFGNSHGKVFVTQGARDHYDGKSMFGDAHRCKPHVEQPDKARAQMCNTFDTDG